MKIYYFTGTGNSLYVAKTVAAKVGNSTLERIISQNTAFPCDADMVGFIFPVYLHRPPHVVTEFITNLNCDKASYFFTIVTHNGEPGGSHTIIDKLLRKKGRRLSANFNILMPGNSVLIVDKTQEEKERARRLSVVDTICTKIAADISRRIEIPLFKDSFLPALKSAFFRIVLLGYPLQKKFNVDAKLCTSCTTCAKVCPAKNIVVDSVPVWGPQCMSCLACYHLCPQHAINIESYTKNRLRYKHPQVRTAELFV